jgi:putative two-component system response regulator
MSGPATCAERTPTAQDGLLPFIERANARILVIDDDPSNIRLLMRLLMRMGCTNVRATSDDRSALALYRNFAPDLVLLDLQMPHTDGYALLERMRAATPNEAMTPVLVLTADGSAEARRRANELGATAFMAKPYDVDEVARRVRGLLDLGAHAQAAFRTVAELGAAGDAEVEETQLMEQLAATCIYNDRLSDGHTQRVGWLAAVIATELRLSPAAVAAIGICAPLHDLGKIAIPDHVLFKPGPLTANERGIAERHATIGSLILSGSRYPLLRLAAEIAFTHHERWDGTGYPRGVAGADIPVAGRIVAVADVYDALTHERPYKSAWTASHAIAEMVAKRGSHFDPMVVDALIRVLARQEQRPAA